MLMHYEKYEMTIMSFGLENRNNYVIKLPTKQIKRFGLQNKQYEMTNKQYYVIQI
jgi:hypothetical protein